MLRVATVQSRVARGELGTGDVAGIEAVMARLRGQSTGSATVSEWRIYTHQIIQPS